MPTLLRVLVIGFAAVIVLMAAAAIIGVTNARSTAALVSDQLDIVRLIDEVEREQSALNATFFELSRTGGDAGGRASGRIDTGARSDKDAGRARMLADLDQTDREFGRIVAEAVGRFNGAVNPSSAIGSDGAERDSNGAEGDSNVVAWRRLQLAVLDFSQQARQLLRGNVPDTSSPDLFSRHEQVTAAVARVVELGYARAVETRDRADRQTETLARETKLLLGGCLVIALACAAITVRIAARVFRQMEDQTSELSRVSFRLLETQESTARRFAHELHDELGGSLTAIKSNLTAIAHSLNGNLSDRMKIDDCIKLIDTSISNVRELSQLLRPTILDDFGLDASLRWLTERFCERTGIEVDYKSEFAGRLPDETETHLFRIVQEALTNVARHSGATKVAIHLRPDGDAIRLTLSDNGRGLKRSPVQQIAPPSGDEAGSGVGMGLSGMRARARSAGGGLTLKSEPGGGVTIEVWAPVSRPATTPLATSTMEKPA
jgi:signal transduction histidine kinase